MRDPVQFRGGQFSLYSYASSDPINRVDVTGLTVSVCRRLSNDPILGFFGLEHEWIETDTMSFEVTGSFSDTYL